MKRDEKGRASKIRLRISKPNVKKSKKSSITQGVCTGEPVVLWN